MKTDKKKAPPVGPNPVVALPPCDMVIVTDAQGVILNVNSVFLNRLQYEQSDIVGQPAASFFTCNGTAVNSEQLISQSIHHDVELNCRDKCGKQFPVYVSRIAIPGTDQTPPSMVLVIRNAEDEHRVRETLAAQQKEFDLILDAVPATIWYKDTQNRFLRVNKFAAEGAGLKAEQIQGKTAYELFPEEADAYYRDDLEVIRSGKPKLNIIERFQGAGGRKWWVRTDKVPYRDENGNITGVVVFSIDITEQKEMEERLRQSSKMAAIGQLAGGIAHDFNNQLASILGYAELVKPAVQNDPVALRNIESIITAAQRAAGLTDQMLAFARKGKYQSVPVHINNVIGEIVELLSHTVDRRITLRRQLDAQPSSIMGDPAQIQNAFLNIALNARDAMIDGGEIKFTTRNVILDKSDVRKLPYRLAPGPYLQIRIQDTGCGMDEKILPRIYEPFFTTKKKGTGMGLASTYGIIKNHGGAIEVDSSPGRGTTFTIVLPLVENLQIPEPSPTEVLDTEHRGHILVVDDEQNVRETVAEMLRRAGHRVTTCINGAEAATYYREAYGDIDLIILDLIMPEMSGHEAFTVMREINPSVRIILASGYSVERRTHRLIDQGGVSFLKKPFREAQLLNVVAEALAGSPPGQPCQQTGSL